MNAYKFLRAGRVAPFSRVVWPQNPAWVDGGTPTQTCHSGVHACRVDQIAYWLSDELWEVELEGPVLESHLKVVAARGRLVRRIAEWEGEARREFAAECARRTASWAAAELRERGLAAEASLLDGAAGFEDLVQLAADAGRAALEAGASDAVTLTELVGDAAGYAKAGDVPGTAFIPAHAAVLQAPLDIEDPFGAERREQARWLAARLGLAATAG